jgi:hypothetical protein
MARSATTSKPAARSRKAGQPNPTQPTAVQPGPVAADRVPSPGEERCACGDPVVRIDLLIDGEEITMVSCSNCDRRSWHRGGREVELDGVLADLSSVPTRYRRDLASR